MKAPRTPPCRAGIGCCRPGAARRAGSPSSRRRPGRRSCRGTACRVWRRGWSARRSRANARVHAASGSGPWRVHLSAKAAWAVAIGSDSLLEGAGAYEGDGAGQLVAVGPGDHARVRARRRACSRCAGPELPCRLHESPPAAITAHETASPQTWSSRVVITPPARTPVSGSPTSSSRQGTSIAAPPHPPRRGECPAPPPAGSREPSGRPIMARASGSKLMRPYRKHSAGRRLYRQGDPPQRPPLPQAGRPLLPPGDFYIDPVRPVARAVITHGHADHARAGHGRSVATPETLAIMAVRYGEGFAGATRPLAYGETIDRDGVEVTLVPAGHVLGSAQVVVRWRGLTMVVSGDYKRRRDPTCPPFEPVACDVFVTEATFGLPVFRHPPTAGDRQAAAIRSGSFPSAATSSAPMRWARPSGSSACCARPAGTAPIFVHGAFERLNALYESFGVDLGRSRPATATTKKPRFAGEIVLAPAFGPGDAVGPALRRSGRRLRLRLDAGQGPGPPARRRAAADHLRPRRLGRTDRHPRPSSARRGLDHPRPRGGAGALVRAPSQASMTSRAIPRSQVRSTAPRSSRGPWIARPAESAALRSLAAAP
jgi:putative mRNA 3-end processing factor